MAAAQMTWRAFWLWMKSQPLNDAYLMAKEEFYSSDFQRWLQTREPKIRKEVLEEAPPDIARRLSA